MRTKLTHALLVACALLFAAPAYADGPGDAGPDVAAPPTQVAPAPTADPAAAPVGRTGVIPLGNGELSINVPEGYRFYSAAEAHAYLQRNSAPAPNGTVFGLLARNGADIRAPGTWATVVSYDPIGYVAPETAAGLSDTNFEADVRTARQTQGRVFEGFASPAAFDTAAPSVTWAERSAAPNAQAPDLRYEQRALGRNGVACLTSIGSADQMTEIAAAAGGMAGMLSFPEGQKHADFQPASDTVSAYSVPALVTGVAPQAQAAADTASTTGGAGQTNFGGLSGYFPWIAGGVLLLAIAGFVMMRRKKDDDDDAEEAA